MSEEFTIEHIKDYISDFKYPNLEGFDVKAIRFLLAEIDKLNKQSEPEKKDVCVWILKDNSEIPNGRSNTFHIWYGTGCDNYYQYPHEKALRFNFCPYCGKKIEVK